MAEERAGVRLVHPDLLEERVVRLPGREPQVREVVQREGPHRLLHGGHLKDGGWAAVPP